jgi:NAD-dependent DNA ligase
MAEMVGLVRGVIADGVVSRDEADRLARWTREHADVATQWPANVLARRLEQIFRDGRVDSRERRHLAAVLSQLAANPSGLGFRLATDLPLDRPEPEVEFEDRTFVFAGDMAFGPRRACEREVEDLGGRCEQSVTRRTDYLVIGGIAALDWAQKGFGGMIDEVVQYRARGVPIAIISEERWIEALP